MGGDWRLIFHEKLWAKQELLFVELLRHQEAERKRGALQADITDAQEAQGALSACPIRSRQWWQLRSPLPGFPRFFGS